MIKLILWLFKNILYGKGLEVDFSYLLSFEEAMEYLKKGYFVYQFSQAKTLYIMIDEEVYAVDTITNKMNMITHFSTNAIKYPWKVLPLRSQVKLNEKEY